MKRFLITTALEETWREDGPVLFLGEWCRRYSRRERWSEMDAEVLPYHWDDRVKLLADYQYLKEFYERLLRDLADQLNEIHGVSHSLRYWRILIGPWLGYFIQMLFDRWTTVQQAADRYEFSGTIVLTGQEEKFVPKDMTDFVQCFVGDEWNHYIYTAILQGFTAVPFVERACRAAVESQKVWPVKGWRKQVRSKLAGWYTQVANLLARDQDALFLSTYLPLLEELRLQLRLRQFPQFRRRVQPVQAIVDWSRRKWVVSRKSGCAFENCARALIPRQIPTAYLEGYRQLVEQTEELRWPKQPRLIWTSNSHNADDVFKMWTAEKVEQGSPLVIGQHGGHYGVGRWSFVEDHEFAISDCYFSWGWTKSEQANIKPVGQLKAKRPLSTPHRRGAYALLVTTTVPRYSYWLYSAMVSRQWLDYFNDQGAFVENLPEAVRETLVVRLYAQDYGWDQAVRWRDRFPGLRLDEGLSDMNELIRKSRLYISTYNATTFLESFTMNVPTVIYWNPNHWELRDSAVPYFEELKQVGIFHETPESAARHVADIWDDVDVWWSSAEVCEVLERFKARYCHLQKDMLGCIESALREVEACPTEMVAQG